MTLLRRLVVALGLLCLSAASAGAQMPIPSQAGNTKNQEVTGSLGATTVVTLTPTPLTRAVVYLIAARCSSGTAQVTITDGGNQKWSSPPSFVGTTQYLQPFTPGWTGGWGNVVLVTLGICGRTATGVLDVQADIF